MAVPLQRSRENRPIVGTPQYSKLLITFSRSQLLSYPFTPKTISSIVIRADDNDGEDEMSTPSTTTVAMATSSDQTLLSKHLFQLDKESVQTSGPCRRFATPLSALTM